MSGIASAGLEPIDLLPENLCRTGSFSGIIQLALTKLRPSDSPRSHRTNSGYARMLAESADRFPPIIVHRESMTVIDGNQRVEATRLRGEATIPAVFYEGDAKTAFVLAVRLNVAHGLPLTIAERKAAALRLLTDHPEWSDRSIAAVSGISDKTVAVVRRLSGGRSQRELRIGRDGTVHRALNEQGRRRAAQLLSTDPDAPLREIAAAAGISLTTAKDVRSRVRRGEDPIPTGRRPKRNTASGNAIGPLRDKPAPGDPESAMRRLSLDPSVRFSESGRNLVRWLALSKIDENAVEQIVTNLPEHCVAAVAAVARQRSNDWRRLARLLAEPTAERAVTALTGARTPTPISPVTSAVVPQHDRRAGLRPHPRPAE